MSLDFVVERSIRDGIMEEATFEVVLEKWAGFSQMVIEEKENSERGNSRK